MTAHHSFRAVPHGLAMREPAALWATKVPRAAAWQHSGSINHNAMPSLKDMV